MRDLKVILIQTALMWENIDANISMFDQYLDKIAHKVDLIVLPEMFNTGFTMQVDKCSEPNEGSTFRWMQQKAVSFKAVITGSVLTEDHGKYYNRMYWVKPDGTYDYYDKRHLFRMGNEHKTMTQGNVQKIVELNGWKINLQVCYDLRFPVWSKNSYQDGNYAYDLLIYVANWPAIRRHAYLPLLNARAIENQACLLWVNRVGKDGNEIDHSGDTRAIDAKGLIVNEAQSYKEEILQVDLSAEELVGFRNKFTVGMDWDKHQIL